MTNQLKEVNSDLFQYPSSRVILPDFEEAKRIYMIITNKFQYPSSRVILPDVFNKPLGIRARDQVSIPQ